MMNQLPETEVADIGRMAARLFPETGANLVKVRTANDPSGDIAYYLDFSIKPMADPRHAVEARLRLAHAVRDELIRRGDETYPYVWVRAEQTAQV